MRRLLIRFLFLLALPLVAAEPFEIKDGDRVVLLGDALLEREDTYGYLETRMHEQFPDRNFTVRNISWAGDTPKGWSRASFDPAEKGMDRLREAIELTKPTVVFLGYGMAASLQEMTDRAQDPTLNPDPARYSREPMSAARFKKELGELMTSIEETAAKVNPVAASKSAQGGASLSGVKEEGRLTAQEASAASTPGEVAAASGAKPTTPKVGDQTPRGKVLATNPDWNFQVTDQSAQKPLFSVAINTKLQRKNAVRFVLLSPIRHEDLRARRPGLPDPAPHNALLAQYAKAIEELAQERGARFVDLQNLTHAEIMKAGAEIALSMGLAEPDEVNGTTNGIHPTKGGYGMIEDTIMTTFGFEPKYLVRRDAPTKEMEARAKALKAAVLRKNAVFFHRFRPANLTYLTGFRKHEQGQNAKEIAEFDALVAAADAEIDRLKRAQPRKSEKGAPGAFLDEKNRPPGVPAAFPGREIQKTVESAAETGVGAPFGDARHAVSTAKSRSGDAPEAVSDVRRRSRNVPEAVFDKENYFRDKPEVVPHMENRSRNVPEAVPHVPNRAGHVPAAVPGILNRSGDVPAALPDIANRARSVPGAAAHVPKNSGDALFAQNNVPPPKPLAVSAPPAPAPLPDFTVLDGYQIELWAENPHLEKPTQMNWDAQGRLWVASSNTYPQVDPQDVAISLARQVGVGEKPNEAANPAASPLSAGNDKIIILEDTDRDGKADKSTVFADGLLIPTGVVPDLVTAKDAPASPSACYVAQSTELLHLADTDGDGRADQRRVVFSGFGTEDTHHLIHTLRWGPDGRLYFNQSVYIHSHLETPWGMVRLNAGGVFAYDPRTERVEVFCKGLWNTWGHAWDDWGQSFLTDGAGRDGISWAFPGAVFAPSEGARKTMPSVSPGSYPKFCGLEIVKSLHFPADWQGNAITCDFRAHRIVRFAIDDLSGTTENTESTEMKKGVAASATNSSPNSVPSVPSVVKNTGKSGYVTRELPDLLRTSDASFRPIDVRLGPDGALYIADWSNPVINHGEVDFRDPRRDKERGRIWRITKKDTPVVKWEPLVGKKNEALLDALLSGNAWEKERAPSVLVARSDVFRRTRRRGETASDALRHFDHYELMEWSNSHGDDAARLQALRLFDGLGYFPLRLQDSLPQAIGPRIKTLHSIGLKLNALLPGLAASRDPRYRASIIRSVGVFAASVPTFANNQHQLNDRRIARELIESSVGDPNPRVRLEAMRALARSPTARSAELFLTAARNAPKDDPHYEFAAWQSINDLAGPWTEAIASGAWKADTAEREAQLAWGLKAIDPALAGATLAKLVAEKKVPLDGTGPWFELIGTAGGPAELQPLWDSLLVSFAGNCCETDETRALEGKAVFFDKTDTGARAMAAVLAAARTRNLRPAERTHLTGVLFHVDHQRAGAVELAGLWKTPDAPERLPELMGAADLTPELRRTIFRALRAHGSGEARALIENWTAADAPTEGRREAVLTLAAIDFAKAAPLLPGVLAKFPDENAALPYWRDLLAIKGAPDELAKLFATDAWKNVAKPLRAAREAGKPAAKLLAALGPVEAAPRNYKDYANSARTDGDPVKGEMIYRRANLACVTCHAIGGAGGKVGPDMTSLGASAPLDYIIESVLAPAVKVKEGYNAVSVTMLDGLVVSGVQVRETAADLVVRDALGKEQSVPKGQIKAKTDIGSIMPAGLVEQLPHREQMDLFHFLGELGKPGPYDASKGSVARYWQLSNEPPAANGTLHVNAAAIPAYTLVDGRLLKEPLAELVPLVSARGEPAVFAITQFQSAGKTRLKLTGASKAWLDGQPLALTNGEATPDVASGTHTLAVQLDAKSLPEVLRAESPDARFLGN